MIDEENLWVLSNRDSRAESTPLRSFPLFGELFTSELDEFFLRGKNSIRYERLKEFYRTFVKYVVQLNIRKEYPTDGIIKILNRIQQDVYLLYIETKESRQIEYNRKLLQERVGTLPEDTE